MENYLISILMTAYNSEKTIEKAIKSVLDQSFKNWELIIVDDCSKDKTNEIIKSYSNKFTNIIYITNTINSGAYLSLNKAMEISKGDYITKLDSDDYYHKDKILCQLKNCIQNNSQVSSCNIVRYCDNKSITQNCVHSSIMFSRKVIETIGYFDNLRFGCDTEFYNRVSNKFKITHIPRNLYFSLIRDDSLTQSKNTGLRKNKGKCLGSIIRENYRNNYQKQIDVKIPHPLFTRSYRTHPSHKSPIEIEFNYPVEIFDSSHHLVFYVNTYKTIGRIYFKLEKYKYKLNNPEKYLVSIENIDKSQILNKTDNIEIEFTPNSDITCMCLHFNIGFNVYKPLIFS